MDPNQNTQNDAPAPVGQPEFSNQANTQYQAVSTPTEQQTPDSPASQSEPIETPLQPVNNHSASDPDLFERPQFATLLKYDSVLLAGVLLLLFHGLLTFITTQVTSYDTAVFMRFISGLLLAATPLFLGAGTVALLVKHQEIGIKLNQYTRFGLSLIPLAAILAFAPFPMNAISPLLLLVSLVLLIVGQTLPVVANHRVPLEGLAKYALLVAGFLVAGIFGLIVSFIMYIIIDLKVCELSSSKCY